MTEGYQDTTDNNNCLCIVKNLSVSDSVTEARTLIVFGRQ